MSDEPLRVVIVCQGDLGGASEKQALGFSEQLTARGHQVFLSLRGDPETAAREGATDIAGLTVHFHDFRGPRLRAADLAAARAFRPDLIHAFNPRSGTMAATRAYARATHAPVFVHWEDDEWSIRGGYGRRSLPRRVARLGRRVLAPLVPSQGLFVTRRTLDWIRANAAGHDALTPALAERVHQGLGRPCAVVLPITPKPKGARPAAAPALPAAVEGHTLVGLTGEIHPGSVDDLDVTLRAVALLQRRGRRVALVHAGKALPRFDLPAMTRAAGVEEGTAVFLGYLPFAQIPPLLERLDVVVQPGEPSDFNRLRLPSKMQAYLESGTPTITFGVGFAELLADGEEVLKLHGFEPEELADRIEQVIADDALRERLAAGARSAATRLLDPARNCEALVEHYRGSLAGATPRMLYVIQQREYSGAETAQVPVLRGDTEPLVACPPESSTEEWLQRLGVATTPLPYRPMRVSGGPLQTLLSLGRTPRNALDLRRVMRAHPERSVIVGVSPPASILASVARVGLRGRHVAWTVTDRLPRAPLDRLIGAVARAGADKIVCHSRFVADDLSARGRVPRARIEVIPPGTPAQREEPVPWPRARRAVVVGHISPTKRTDLAVEIARRVLARGCELELEIIGAAQFRDEDFELEKRLRTELADDPQLGAHVRLLGHRSDAAEHVREATMLLHCRPDEPFGMVLIEAMAAGTPVVAPAAAGPLEIVAGGETGLLYPPGDADAAAAAVIRLLDEPGLAERMGEAGRRRALDHYDAERQAQRTLAALRRLAEPGIV